MKKRQLVLIITIALIIVLIGGWVVFTFARATELGPRTFDGTRALQDVAYQMSLGPSDIW
jgi:hypothetical protein